MQAFLWWPSSAQHGLRFNYIICCRHKNSLPTRTGASARIQGPVIVLERSLILLCQIVNGWRQAEGNDSSSWHNKEIFTRTVLDNMNASSSVIVCSRCPKQEPVQVLSLVVRLLFCSETQPRRTRTYVRTTSTRNQIPRSLTGCPSPQPSSPSEAGSGSVHRPYRTPTLGVRSQELNASYASSHRTPYRSFRFLLGVRA